MPSEYLLEVSGFWERGKEAFSYAVCRFQEEFHVPTTRSPLILL